MKTTCFSIATDGNNYQKLKKMNPVTLRIFDRNQHKVVTKFFDMCKSREANAKEIFKSIDTAMSKCNVSWDKCVSVGLGNTYVNVGSHNSVIVNSRKKNVNVILMGCHFLIADNAAAAINTKSNGWFRSDHMFCQWRVACGYLFSLWLLVETKKHFCWILRALRPRLLQPFKNFIVFAGLVWQPVLSGW